MIERRVDIAFGRLAAQCWGDPALPPLLALHGWLDNCASFAALAPLLEGYHVVALDLAGHGRSAHRAPGQRYHHVDHVSDMLDAADAMGWSEFSLLGHSMGASIAALLAAGAPERVRRVLLIEGLGPPTSEPAQAVPQLRRALIQHAGAATKALRVFPTLQAAIAARVAATGLSPDAARRLVERGTVAVEGGYSWSSDPRLTLDSPIRFAEPQVLALLEGIRAPVTLVMADPPMPYFKPVLMAARIAAVADISVTRLAGSHHLHMEQPAAVAAVFSAG